MFSRDSSDTFCTAAISGGISLPAPAAGAVFATATLSCSGDKRRGTRTGRPCRIWLFTTALLVALGVNAAEVNAQQAAIQPPPPTQVPVAQPEPVPAGLLKQRKDVERQIQQLKLDASLVQNYLALKALVQVAIQQGVPVNSLLSAQTAPMIKDERPDAQKQAELPTPTTPPSPPPHPATPAAPQPSLPPTKPAPDVTAAPTDALPKWKTIGGVAPHMVARVVLSSGIVTHARVGSRLPGGWTIFSVTATGVVATDARGDRHTLPYVGD